MASGALIAPLGICTSTEYVDMQPPKKADYARHGPKKQHDGDQVEPLLLLCHHLNLNQAFVVLL